MVHPGHRLGCAEVVESSLLPMADEAAGRHPRGMGKRTADAVTLAVAVGVFGVSYGVLAVSAGLDAVMASASSVLVFGGGSQFAAVAVLAAGGTPVAAVAAGLLLNVRYAAFGVALARRLPPGSLLRRMVAAHLVIDESAAMGLASTDKRESARLFWLTGAACFVSWNVGTLVGALAGGALGEPERWGLDVAFAAGFLALLAPRLRDRAGRAAALGGALIAVALFPVLPPGGSIIAAAAGALLGLRRTSDVEHARAEVGP